MNITGTTIHRLLLAVLAVTCLPAHAGLVTWEFTAEVFRTNCDDGAGNAVACSDATSANGSVPMVVGDSMTGRLSFDPDVALAVFAGDWAGLDPADPFVHAPALAPPAFRTGRWDSPGDTSPLSMSFDYASAPAFSASSSSAANARHLLTVQENDSRSFSAWNRPDLAPAGQYDSLLAFSSVELANGASETLAVRLFTAGGILDASQLSSAPPAMDDLLFGRVSYTYATADAATTFQVFTQITDLRAVPAPATLALFFVGLLGLRVSRRP